MFDKKAKANGRANDLRSISGELRVTLEALGQIAVASDCNCLQLKCILQSLDRSKSNLKKAQKELQSCKPPIKCSKD